MASVFSVVKMSIGGKQIYRFGAVEVDPTQHSIKRNGEEQHLRQRSFEVLVYLLENRDRAISKDELIEKLWKVAAVTDDALVQSIVEIRKAVGEDSRKPRIIKTIPKTGYRFIAQLEETDSKESTTEIEEVESIEFEVEEEISDPVLAIEHFPRSSQSIAIPAKKRTLPVYISVLLMVLTAVCVYVGSTHFRSDIPFTSLPNNPGSKSIAVMFFDNQSEDQDLNWLREGLADMVITGLSHSSRLNLLSRQQLHLVLERIGHKESEKIRLDEAIDIAHRTKAEAFILGSFARLGDQIRIDVQLYDTQKQQLLGADNLIVQKPEEILTNVDLLSLKIASHLGIMPSSGEQIADFSHVMTTNLDAFRYYSLAVEKAQGLHNKEAIDLLQKAIAIDPQFAMAHARIGFTYAVTWNYPDQAKPYLQKAFQLSDHLTEKDKLYISAWYAIANQDYSSAILYFRKIINQYPFDVEAYIRLGRLLVGEGRYQEGLDCYKRGLLIDPDNKDIYNSLGGLYGSLGKYQEAIEMDRMYIKLAPSEPNSHDSLALTYQNSGHYAQAIEEYNHALSLNPDFEVAVVHLGNTYFQMGRYNDAILQYKRYIAIAPSELEKKRGAGCLAHVYWKKNEPAKAADLIPQLTDSTELMLIAMALGDKSRAEHLLQEIPVKRGPGRGQRLESRTYYFPVGYYFLKTGKTAEAIENFKKALQDVAPVWNIDTFEDCLANAYLELNRPDEAIVEYDRILRLNPNYPLLHFHLARAYEARGDMDQAREEYVKFLQIWKDADSDIPEILIARQRLQEPAKQI